MKAINIDSALNILGLNKSIHLTQSDIKKAYKQKALESHPDRSNESSSMALINAAYAFIKQQDFIQLMSDIADSNNFDNMVFQANEGHALHGSGLPSLLNVNDLIADFGNTSFDASNINHGIHFAQSAYFQANGSDFRFGYYADTITMENITNGGKRGKLTNTITFKVENWNINTPQDQWQINTLITSFIDSTELVNDFSWDKLFNAFIDALPHSDSSKFKSEGHTSFNVLGKEFKIESWGQLSTIIDGNRLDVYLNTYKSNGVFNPYTLKQYKPLKQIPTKFNRTHLIKILLNGQFFNCKQNYNHTDDYYYDASVNYSRGYVNNPIKLAYDWITSTSSSELIYTTTNEETKEVIVRFGETRCESFSLTIALDNQYPLVSMDKEIETLEEQLKLTA